MLVLRGRSSSIPLLKNFSSFKYKAKYLSSLSTLPIRKWQKAIQKNPSNISNINQNRFYTRDSSKSEKVGFFL
jgi:hypothetical protein